MTLDSEQREQVKALARRVPELVHAATVSCRNIEDLITAIINRDIHPAFLPDALLLTQELLAALSSSLATAATVAYGAVALMKMSDDEDT